METHETSDVKATGMSVLSRERDRVSDTSRRLTATGSNIPEIHKLHIKDQRLAGRCQLSLVTATERGAHTRARRVHKEE